MVTLKVLGLNCGTSIDAIDVALCRISSQSASRDIAVELLSYTEVAVNPDLRAQLLRLCRPNNGDAGTTLAEVCDLNFALGKEFSRAIHDSGLDLREVDLIASHGQTLWHRPEGENRSTLQMAEPAVIAHSTQKTVGAPLSGFFEAALLSHPDKTRIIQNIGGIGNASVLPATGDMTAQSASTYLAFDTGPGNVLIDAAMRIISDGRLHYDHDGALGLEGQDGINPTIVDRFLDSEPYFRSPLPKTTGRELFSDDVARHLVEEMRALGMTPPAIIATVTRITAESIARAYKQLVMPTLGGKAIDEIYLCGGGAYNPNITNHLRAQFPDALITKLDDAPIKLDPSAKEAVLFAVLGFLGICGRTVPIAGCSETTNPAILGVITPGENYHPAIKSSASILASDMMQYYKGNLPGQTPGILPGPPPTGDYYWWEAGAMWGTLIDYWAYTGDSTYNHEVMAALQFQVGQDDDYQPRNVTASLGNDDQGFWGMSAMLAAESKFPDPPADKPQWLALAQAVFNTQASPERHDDRCGGGLRWQIPVTNAGYDYKNSIANGCLFNLGARLYRYTGNKTYSDWAVKTWDWMIRIGLIDNSTYAIYDGANIKQECAIINRPQFSYNNAIFAQGAAFMYNATEDPIWKERTERLVQHGLKTFFPNNIATEIASTKAAIGVTGSGRIRKVIPGSKAADAQGAGY
ncbi:peptidase S15 [Purpureocillium lavendulum]|uniref:mannan endo-1,6-alpha-mannosidase n=1 Tax=Purpureocillium lavendulum TaxID=1247861 RepID=A0AB34FYF0_9HYPO|nr:peptidase S15 [Purpureocillium lavendulum]